MCELMEITAMEVRVIQLYIHVHTGIYDHWSLHIHIACYVCKHETCNVCWGNPGGCGQWHTQYQNGYPPCICPTVCSNMQNKALRCMYNIMTSQMMSLSHDIVLLFHGKV